MIPSIWRWVIKKKPIWQKVIKQTNTIKANHTYMLAPVYICLKEAKQKNSLFNHQIYTYLCRAVLVCSAIRCWFCHFFLFIVNACVSLCAGNNTEFDQRNALLLPVWTIRLKLNTIRYIRLFRLSFLSARFRRACVFSTEPSRIVCAFVLVSVNVFFLFSIRLLFYLCNQNVVS